MKRSFRLRALLRQAAERNRPAEAPSHAADRPNHHSPSEEAFDVRSDD